MNNAQKNIVERLGNNPSDLEARAAFDDWCQTDPSFRNDATLHLAAMAALKQGQNQHVRQLLEDPDMQAFKEKTWRQLKYRRVIQSGLFLLLTVLLIGLGVLIWRQPKTSIPEAPTYLPAPAVQQTPDDQQQTEPATTPPVAQQKPNNKRLFAQYFSTYDAAFAKNMTRGSNRVQHIFFDHYEAGNYVQAVATEPVDSVSPVWLFYRANAWMAMGRPEQALPLLASIDTRQNILLAQQVQWYQALALLQNGDLERAKGRLQAIAKRPDGAYKAKEARDLIGSLKNTKAAN
jgi:hypothetical protein